MSITLNGKVLCGIMAGLVLFSIGCRNEQPSNPLVPESVAPSIYQHQTVTDGNTALLKSTACRDSAPLISAAATQTLVEDNTGFALALYRQVVAENSNLFFSPYSISQALAMTYAGARAATQTEMAAALRFTLEEDTLHKAFNAIDQRIMTSAGTDTSAFKLSIANALWGEKTEAFEQEFLDVNAINYGAGLHLLDFVNAPDPARLTINGWVSLKTNNRINDLIPAGVIDGLTRLVLTNAIYFNAQWADKFTKESTRDGEFYPVSGDSLTTPFMHSIRTISYNEGTNWQAIELLYKGNTMAMDIILPAQGTLAQFEAGMTAQSLKAVFDGFQSTRIALALPKFKFASPFISLVTALSALGMPVAFTGAADFSGINGQRNLCIGDVIHKAFVAVDERGTEAAAATAVTVKTTSAPLMESPVYVTIDRPFIFLIRDLNTGTVLFLGRIMRPVNE